MGCISERFCELLGEPSPSDKTRRCGRGAIWSVASEIPRCVPEGTRLLNILTSTIYLGILCTDMSI